MICSNFASGKHNDENTRCSFYRVRYLGYYGWSTESTEWVFKSECDNLSRTVIGWDTTGGDYFGTQEEWCSTFRYIVFVCLYCIKLLKYL